MLVSVIIPAFNAEAYLGETLQSCLNQSLDDLDVIVVDDGSTDRTAEIAISFADPRLKLIRQENQGVGAARNHALEHAQGHYVQFLDADDVLERRKLEHQAAALQAAGDCGMSTSRWGRFFGSTADPWFVPAPDWTDLDPATFAELQFGDGGMMPPNSWLIPRKIIGDVRFHTCVDAFEDRVFLAQMAERSQRIIYCGEAVSYYRSGIANSLSAQRGRHKMARAYVAAQLLTEILLRIERSERMRRAAATYWMKLAVEAYPFNRAIALLAEENSMSLGLTTWRPESERNKFGAVARTIGWKPAALMRHWSRVLLQRFGVNLVSRRLRMGQ